MLNVLEPENTVLGIELGSTRIKAVLIGPDRTVVASGAHDWKNRQEDGYWTYHLDDVWAGVQDAYAELAADLQAKHGVPLTSVGALGISAMMHGYLPFDAQGRQLVPFRTWRNTTTGPAATELTELFEFNIPQRWSIAHLYQAMLNGEEHVKDIAFLTTLAGYVHWRLTGEKVLGVGEASGMFPIDSAACGYDAAMMRQFDDLLQAHELQYRLEDILPRVLCAGEAAGVLTAEGAKLLNPTGALRSGVPLCPPEGDAGTGMVATNSVATRTGNVSAGTSVFAMAVLEKPLSKVYPEIDLVTTPTGAPVAMVHCNTCTSDLDAWVKLLGEMAGAAGAALAKPALYDLRPCELQLLFRRAGDRPRRGAPAAGAPAGCAAHTGESGARTAVCGHGHAEAGHGYSHRWRGRAAGHAVRPWRAVQNARCGPAAAGGGAGRARGRDGNGRRGRALGHGAAGGVYAGKARRRDAGTLFGRPRVRRRKEQRRAPAGS